MKLSNAKFLGLLLLAAPLAFSSCKDYDEDAINELKVDQLAQIAKLQDQITELAGKIKDAKDGKDGETPFIGSNGNWWIGNTDTGVPAAGQKGDKGDTGAQGAQGEKGETGATGAQGEKGDKGDTGATGAQGEKGDKGDTGAQGAQGEKGDKGDTGATGAQGAQGEKGEDGLTPFIGDNGNWWIGDTDTKVPAAGRTGATGAQGEKGDQGEKGENGLSAYEIAVKYGFEGTEPEWLASLKGDRGYTGRPGADGTAGGAVTVEKYGINSDGEYYIKFTNDDNVYITGHECKCDHEKYDNAVKVVYEITKAFAEPNQILTDAELADFGAKVKKALDDIEKALKYIDNLKERATSITIDAVNNNVFGTYKTSVDMQTNMLYGFFGKIGAPVAFPVTSDVSGYESYYGDLTEVLSVPSSVTVNTETVKAGDVFDKQLGTVFFSINPSEVDFSGVDVSLVNSQNEEAGISLSAVKASEETLHMGYTAPLTRAGGIGFYETTATVDAFDKVEKIELNTDNYIDLAKTIKDREGRTTAFLTALRTTLNAMETDAYAIKMATTDDLSTADGNQHIVKSPFNIQAALMKPIGYEAMSKISASNPFSASKLTSLVNKVVEKALDAIVKGLPIDEVKNTITKQQNKFKDGISKIKFAKDDAKFTATITCKDGSDCVVELTEAELKELYNVIDDDVKTYKEMLDGLNETCDKALDMLNKIDASKFADKISSTIEDAISNIMGGLSNAYEGIESRLELALLWESDGKYGALRRSIATAPAVGSSFTCWMTNLNLETIVPAYKKHLVVTDAFGASDKDAAIAAVNASINKVYPGSTKKVTISGLQSGVTYKIAYSGLDYAGKQETRYFYVKCK